MGLPGVYLSNTRLQLPIKLNRYHPGLERSFLFSFKDNIKVNLPRNKAHSRQNEQNILYIEEDCQYATFLLIHLIAVGFIHTLISMKGHRTKNKEKSVEEVEKTGHRNW